MSTALNIFIDFMQKGGFFMWPLLVTGLLASFLILHKAWLFYQLHRHFSRHNLPKIRAQLLKKEYPAITSQLSVQTPVEKILAKGVSYLQKGFDEQAIEERLEMIYEEELQHLDRGLAILAILGELMPMLGLLGTVSGMIAIFKVIASLGGGNAEMMAAGIAEALITTETGLVLAIPTMFCHTLLNNQVEKQARLMRQASALIITSSRVLKNQQKHV